MKFFFSSGHVCDIFSESKQGFRILSRADINFVHVVFDLRNDLGQNKYNLGCMLSFELNIFRIRHME